jgi:lipoprotein-releasing system ATP-binding protein
MIGSGARHKGHGAADFHVAHPIGSRAPRGRQFSTARPTLNWRLEEAVRIEKLSKIYRSGEHELAIFRGLDLSIAAGEMVAVIGESGAGKSTLLHLMAGLDRPTSGAIFYSGRNIAGFAEPELSSFRNREIGYVWQQHHLLPEFTALENVAMPLLIGGAPRHKAEIAAAASLEEVGLGARGHHRAGELSGGEQQRVAIARALAAGPSVLLADESTGNLDERTAESVFALLADLRRRRSLTCVLVTHNLRFAGECDRILRLEAGILRCD